MHYYIDVNKQPVQVVQTPEPLFKEGCFPIPNGSRLLVLWREKDYVFYAQFGKQSYAVPVEDLNQVDAVKWIKCAEQLSDMCNGLHEQAVIIHNFTTQES